ncbi:MAG: two-component system, OmpR family, response regulator, partial [Solirubrobacterales bacterium]|nr:two-component system, OmpR family, response regulator [Solirubrobacterales bacterium]
MNVLVVEDEVKMAALIRRGLSEQGLTVDVAGTGEEAVGMARSSTYDAVVLDVILPGIDGFEVCRQWRDAGRWMPVLMLTARDAIDDRVRGLDVGADDYLTKPFSFGELFARLRALLRRGPTERPTVLTVGDLVYDPATKVVRRGDVIVTMSAKELALLEYFMRNAGMVLSRTDLIDHVWDFAYDGTSNVVDVYVRYL